MFQQFDFSTFHSSSGEKREEFCRKLVASLQDHQGFIRLINHGVPTADIDDAFAMVCGICDAWIKC